MTTKAKIYLAVVKWIISNCPCTCEGCTELRDALDTIQKGSY